MDSIGPFDAILVDIGPFMKIDSVCPFDTISVDLGPVW